MRRYLFPAVLLASLLARSLTAQIPTPASHFGFEPGTNRQLANWSELTAYYDRLAATADRVTVDTLGASTEGRPFVMLTVTSPANHDRLEELRQIHLRLADPRTITDPSELADLKEAERAIVLLTSHVHSTEVGAGQMPANLLYRLATSDAPEILEILDEVVLLVVPSLNPDGTELVSNWYRLYRGTEFEGAPPVKLYHPYIGHDNNRDWYAFTQVETQLTVEKVHNYWRPTIVHDVHQMGPTGARIFVPPYVEPFERNVDPLIISAINQAGSYMAAEMLAEGLTGVVTAAQYDLFTPARAYQHYHGGVRILSETASARLATPITLEALDMTAARGYHPNQPGMNFPAPWPGGEWGLEDIVRYQEAGAMALLKNAARNRTFWVDNFLAIQRRATGKWPGWPDYWVIPADQDQLGLQSVLRILTMGSVEVFRTTAAFESAGRRYDAGSFVIPMRQPYAAWAQTMLEPQEYPDLREYPGGPPTRPYDVTAHTLPLLMGVMAVPVWDGSPSMGESPIETVDVDFTPPAALVGPGAPRIALYQGWRESLAAGWTRWLFDQFGIPYTTLSDARVRAGDLASDFDVILFQEQPTTQIVSGWTEGDVPPEFTGGIGPAGMEALRVFVEGGGRMVAVESAASLPIQIFNLPITDPLIAHPASEFYAPGAIVHLRPNAEHPLVGDATDSNAAWFWRTSRVFESADPAVRVVARYGSGDPRLSGWVLGGHYLADRPAIVEMDVGRGSVVMFGFQPNYRGHSVVSWPLLFNSLSVGLR